VKFLLRNILIALAWAGCLTLVGWIYWSGDRGMVASIVQGILAPIGVFLALLPFWLSRKERVKSYQEARQATIKQRADAADDLARQMAEQWRTEASNWGITRPAPINVRWMWGKADIAAPRAEINTSLPDGIGPKIIPSTAPAIPRTGTITNLYDTVYSRLKRGRLVILGSKGSGKTAAMMLLMLAALAHRSPDGDGAKAPVPVWLTLSGWDPYTVPLLDWAATVMVRDHRFLRANGSVLSLAKELLTEGIVALFLDGFDEIPKSMQAMAMKQLDGVPANLIIVMSSGRDEYRDARNAAPFHNAAVIELLPLTRRSVSEYLTHDQNSHLGAWKKIVDDLEGNQSSIAARALQTPLMLYLARAAYQGRDPSELVDPTKFATEGRLRSHLFAQYLVAAYPNARERANARRGLTWVAKEMKDSRDLAWWQIPTWIDAGQHWAGAAITSMVGGALVLFPLFGEKIDISLIVIPLLLFLDAVGSIFVVMMAIQVAWLMSVFGSGMMGDSRERFREGPIFGSPTGPRSLVIRLPHANEITNGLGSGVVCGYACSWIGHFVAQLVAGPGFLLELAFGVSGGLLFGLIDIWLTPVEGQPSATPFSSYRDDRRTSLICGISGGLVFGSLAGLAVGVNFGPIYGVAFGLFVGVFFAMVFGNGNTLAILFSNIYLLVTRRRLVKIITLLEDAHKRQVLRQAGAVYQFRHAELQDYLCGEPPVHP
jgi:hypothetical protein